MPKFVIERQYMVPMYQHILVEAENLEMACEMAVSDDIDWDTQEMDCDSARATTITEAKVIPGGYELDRFQRVLVASKDLQNRPLGMLTLATFLYEDESKSDPRLKIPARFTEDQWIVTPLRQQLKGCVASEPSGS
jgi:hypothetical protein